MAKVSSIQTTISRGTHKVETYSIPGPFLKLEYLKTELKEENGTYTIVHRLRNNGKMINLAISGYFKLIYPLLMKDLGPYQRHD